MQKLLSSHPLFKTLSPSSQAVTDGKHISTRTKWTYTNRNIVNGTLHNIQMYLNVKPLEAMAYVGEMNPADGDDDDKADDEGGDGHKESVPSQALGPVIVSVIVTVPGLVPKAKGYAVQYPSGLTVCLYPTSQSIEP